MWELFLCSVGSVSGSDRIKAKNLGVANIIFCYFPLASLFFFPTLVCSFSLERGNASYFEVREIGGPHVI